MIALNALLWGLRALKVPKARQQQFSGLKVLTRGSLVGSVL